MTFSYKLQTKGGSATNPEKRQIPAMMVFLQDNWKAFSDKKKSNSTVDTGERCDIHFIHRNGGDNSNVVLSGTPTEVA